MRGRVLVAAVCALLSAARAGAITVDDLPADAVYTLAAVRITGDRSVSDRAILGVMLQKPPPWYKPWKGHPKFNPDLLRTDLERVRTLLRESGHYEARVSHELEVKGDELTIVLIIDDGPAARVGEIVIVAADFTLASDEEAALRRLLTLEPEAVFTQEAYDQSRAKLERHYLEDGFAYVEVAKAAVVDTATDLVRVSYTITRRGPAVFGSTTIGGTRDVADRLIRREIAYNGDDPYDPRKIEETQAKVFGLHLFRSVAVKPTNLGERSGTVDMAVDVTEGPEHELKAGIGYGLEDGPRGQLRWQDYNFFGGGRQLGVQLKASLIEKSIQGEFRQPHFLRPQQSFVAPLTQTLETEPAFTNLQLRFAPRIERKFTPHLKGSLAYNIEHDDVSDVPNETEDRIGKIQERGFLSSVVGVFEHSTTVDLLDPHDGGVVNLTAEVAGGPLQGDFGFYQALLEVKRYVPVFGERVMAGRFRIGGADGFDQSSDVPIFRRFYAGGINSTRGYARDFVGPINECRKDDDGCKNSDRDPVGGRSLLEGSLEFRTPVYKEFGAVAFVDVGEVRRRPWSYTVGDLQFGVGAGVRYNTIVGPIRLDLGFPLQPAPGQAHWQIHFSIGQAF